MRIFFVFLLFYINYVHAGIEEDMGKFFHEMGSMYNATSGNAYNDQLAGYYNGGSIALRNKVRHINPLGIKMPSLRAGCGGIDIFTGGFSYINSDQLVQTMRNVASNAVSYAFLLALSTAAPQVKTVITYVNDLAQAVNGMSINSCEIAATAVGSVWSQSAAASDALCNRVGTNLGIASDYVNARHNCHSERGRSEYMNRAKNDERYKDILVEDFNLAWHAINKNDFLSSDKTLAEFFMSLSGTLIAAKEGTGSNELFRKIPYPSLAERNEIINAMLEGGEATIYACVDQEKCLQIKQAKVNLSPEKSIKGKVSALLIKMLQNMQNDTPHSPEEVGLLSATSLPLYKFLNISNILQKNNKTFSAESYAELIAIDVIFSYLDEVLSLIHTSVAQLKFVQDDSTTFEEFNKGIRFARERLSRERMNAYQRSLQTLKFVEQIKLVEKHLNEVLANRYTPER